MKAALHTALHFSRVWFPNVNWFKSISIWYFQMPSEWMAFVFLVICPIRAIYSSKLLAGPNNNKVLLPWSGNWAHHGKCGKGHKWEPSPPPGNVGGGVCVAYATVFTGAIKTLPSFYKFGGKYQPVTAPLHSFQKPIPVHSLFLTPRS